MRALALSLREVADPEMETVMAAPGRGAGSGVYRGLDGLLTAWRDWTSAFESVRAELEEVR